MIEGVSPPEIYPKLFNIKDNKYEILQTLNNHKYEVYKIIELKNK